MQVPPISPVTQLSGSGLGQKGSALKLGAASGFPASCGPAAGSMLTRPTPRARPRPMVPANATRLSAMTPPLGDQSLWNAQYDHQPLSKTLDSVISSLGSRMNMRERYPERIVCLTEETTETLYLLVDERRIVGISGYTVQPLQARREQPTVY